MSPISRLFSSQEKSRSDHQYPKGQEEKNTAGFKIRRLAIDHHIPLITNPQLAQIFLQCLAEIDFERFACPTFKFLPKHAMKNLLLKGTVKILSRVLRPHPQKNRILIVATTALGDTLWATPAIENIRASFPEAYLAVLTSPIGMEIFKHNPWIDKLHLVKEPLLPTFFSLWKTLYKERFDTVLVFHASQRLALPLCSLLGASRIVGTAGSIKGSTAS